MADTSAPDSASPDGNAPVADRTAVEREVGAASDDRAVLLGLQARYQTRIARHPDDFVATFGLKLVDRRLAVLGHGSDPWDKAVRKLLR